MENSCKGRSLWGGAVAGSADELEWGLKLGVVGHPGGEDWYGASRVGTGGWGWHMKPWEGGLEIPNDCLLD